MSNLPTSNELNERLKTIHQFALMERRKNPSARQHYRVLKQRLAYLDEKIQKRICSEGAYRYLVEERNAMKWVIDMIKQVFNDKQG